MLNSLIFFYIFAQFTVNYNSLRRPTTIPHRWRRRTSPCRPAAISEYFPQRISSCYKKGLCAAQPFFFPFDSVISFRYFILLFHCRSVLLFT